MAQASGVPLPNSGPGGTNVRRARLGKIGRTLLVAGVTAGLPAVATFGAFEDSNDPFQHSVVAPLPEAPPAP